MIYTISDVEKEVFSNYKKNVTSGYYLGFESLKNHYSVKMGSTTYITGIPGHGKTTLLEEFKANLTDFYGIKHLMFSPEMGSIAETYQDLIQVHAKKPFFSTYHTRVTESEIYKVLPKIKEYYKVIGDLKEGDLTVDYVLKLAKQESKENGIGTLTIDPWNELFHDFTKNNGREDIYLEFVLGKIRRFARESKIHVFIVPHPRQPRVDSEGNYTVPTLYDVKGGGAWGAKAESVICPYRPDFKTNLTEIHVHKAKPRIVGKRTLDPCEIYYDEDSCRYYEENYLGEMSYAKPEDNNKPF